MNANEIQKVIAEHNLWLQTRWSDAVKGARADLSGANLSRADLSGADLSRANLSRANLSGADLSRANLSRANLSGANLSRANLSGADLSRADLSRANLSRANLSGAKIKLKNVIAQKLSLLGACEDSLTWVESIDVKTFDTALRKCERRDWMEWLTKRLGGKPTGDRFEAVIDFITGGKFDAWELRP